MKLQFVTDKCHQCRFIFYKKKNTKREINKNNGKDIQGLYAGYNNNRDEHCRQ